MSSRSAWRSARARPSSGSRSPLPASLRHSTHEDDPARVAQAIGRLFPKLTGECAASTDALRSGNSRVGIGATSAVVLGSGVSPIKTTRSYGARWAATTAEAPGVRRTGGPSPPCASPSNTRRGVPTRANLEAG